MKFTRFFLRPDSWGRKRRPAVANTHGGYRDYESISGMDEPIMPEFDQQEEIEALAASVGATGARRPTSE